MDTLLSAAQWVVGKALAPVADGVLEAWDASRNLGLNIIALKTELLLVQATLETASRKQISGKATEALLWKLRDSASCAEDLLDELDYFRIHDKLHGSYDAADQHAKGGVHDLALNARHATTALLGLSSAATPAATGQVVEDARQQRGVGCCAWLAKRRSRGTSSSTPNANLGKLLSCSSSQNVHENSSGSQSALCGVPQPQPQPQPQREHAQETTMLGFNRVDFSERMKLVVEEMQPVRREFNTILQSCDRIIVPDIAQSHPITTAQSVEPKLYGRDQIVDAIIVDMTKGKYHDNDHLTVLPIVGPGGIGKTTVIQHIHLNQEVRNHFQVIIWVCVSISFNLNKLLEDIKNDIPPVEGEKGNRPEELIEQRLKSKRFLLVLDDIWECSNEDDWKRLLLPLKTSQEKGSMILVTTRFPAIAKMVKTTDHIELEGIESEEFRKLFLYFVFGDEPFRSDHKCLLEIGEKIMEKLKGSPLAAKTVGRLLKNDLNLRHWRRVLESKEWERQNGANDIMPALKLSYDYLPFHQQRCFSHSALFPEDYHFGSSQLINFWVGLDILQPSAENQTFEDTGLRILNDLVTQGFFRENKTNGWLSYVMHDLLHDLALQVASHDCFSLHHSNVRSVEIQPSIRHLSIIIDDDDLVSHENFKGQLGKLKTRLKVKQLHTLLLFGELHESFASILGDLFSEANSLRVFRFLDMSSSVESILHNFSTLVHLRYLSLGTEYGKEMHLPLAISRFYHLRFLSLQEWYGGIVLPKDLSNLEKLRVFGTADAELHSDILNVGKLVHLENLKVFRVHKESEGFEPKQLENLNELRELGIYNLENIHTQEEAAEAKVIEKHYLERLTLDWDSERSNIEPDVEAAVLESLQTHPYLEELCIRGHGGPSCPTWLGDKLTVTALQSLHLDGVSWQCLPPLGKMWSLGKVILEHITTLKEFVIEQSFCGLIRLELVGLRFFEKWVRSEDARMFPLLQVLIIKGCPKLLGLPFPNLDQDWNTEWFPKLQEFVIESCHEFLFVAPIPWTETLCRVNISDVKLLEKFKYDSESANVSIIGKDGLQSLDQVLAFNNLTALEKLTLEKCPFPELKHLRMLTSLKKLIVESSDVPGGPLGGERDVEWQLPVEQLVVKKIRGASGKELSKLLTHLPRLSSLEIRECESITQLAVEVDVQQQTTSATATSEVEEEGLLVFPAHMSDSLQELVISDCPELVLVDPSTCLPARGGGLQALRSVKTLTIAGSPKLLSAISSFSFYLFPSSLQELSLYGVKGMATLEPLSNLTSLTKLFFENCGEDLRCKGLGPLLGHLRELLVYRSPIFFTGWDPNPRRVLLQQDDEGEEQEVAAVFSSKVEMLKTDDVMGLLVTPICSLLSSSLTDLTLYGRWTEMERFSKEQDDAIHLIASLQQLVFLGFRKLQHLPAGLHKLTNLKRLEVYFCPAVRSLPKDGLPKSLHKLDVSHCCNGELEQQCRGLLGTIPEIVLEI